MNKLITTIRQIVALTPDEEQVVNRLFHQRTYAKGEHLLQDGEICRYVTFIDTGLVRYYSVADGEERTTYFNKEGEFVCNYPSFLTQIPGYVNIQALEDTTVWVINYHDLQLFYQQLRNGERFGRLAIEEVFVSFTAQITSMYTDDPETRYLKFLSNYPDLQQRIPQYHIASYIGVKAPSLSRIRRRMAAKRS